MNTFLKLTSADQLDVYVEVNRAIGLTWNLEVRNSIFELKLEFMASWWSGPANRSHWLVETWAAL